MKKLSYILLCGLMLILSACEKDTESANFAPVVTTGSASNIYRMGATLSGSITLTETNTAKEYGILFSELESMAEYDEYPVKDGSTNYSVQIQNLEPGTTYYYCAYASSGYSIAKSQIKSFQTTNSNAPVFNEVILQSKDEKSCTIYTELLDEGGSELLMTGFVWAEAGSGDPTIKSNVVNVEPQGSRMSATIKSMEPNKTYLVRAYGVNAQGVGYSNSISVTTNTATVPVLSDIIASDSTEVSITVKSTIVDAGLGEVTKFGFCYSSESKNPTTDHLVVENIEGDSQNFSALIDGLKPETIYYIRAYAINEKGAGYSETFVCATKTPTEPGIYSLNDLIAFRDAYNADEDVSKWKNSEGIINIFADIDMSSVDNWGMLLVLNETDIFEGNGHTISGLKMAVDLSKTLHSGFFSVNNGIIRNLIIDGNISISCPVDNSYLNSFGGFCGVNNGTVLNCIFKGQIVSITTIENLACYITGIVGYNKNGDIELCKNYGNISSDYNVSGICGYNTDGIIDECDNYGTITGKRDAAGIAAMNYSAKIINCNNYGNIIADMVPEDYFPYASGIASSNHQSVIENCINEGEVSAYNSSGICDYNSEEGVIRECINKGIISATDNSSDASGINGTNHGIIEKCTNEGVISGGSAAGGITNYNYATIMNCTNFGDVCVSSEGYYAAGIANRCSDYHREFVVEGCVNSGNIMGGANGAHIAGVISGIDASYGVYSNNTNNGTINGEPGTDDNAIGYDTRVKDSYNITLKTAGTLASLIPESDKYSVTKLKVAGPLNGDDIRFIREMAGRDVNGNETTGSLVDLDISEATIVEGGGAYYDIYYTKNDVVGYNMFEETILKQVFLPNSVILIDFSAFEHCTSLTSINIPDGVTSIGDQAFYNCTSLTSIDIPNGVTEIGTSTFSECTALTSVTIGNSVTSIGNWAFDKCSSLASVNIPDGVTSIGVMAFYGCSSLTGVYISDLTAWCKINFDGRESNPLDYAGKLYLNNKMITDLVIPNDIAEIKNYAYVGCTSLVSVVIPDGVTLIGEDAFSQCSSLTSINIPDGVTSIGSAFTNCSSLTSINIPDGVTLIESRTFYDCSSLTAITIPDGVTEIGEMAFYACNSLAEVTCNATTPPTLGSNAFKSIAQNSKLILPADAYDAYVATDWANYFATITDGKPHGEYTNGVATLDRAGTLSSLFPGDEKYSITKLKIIGSLNGVDIRFIREMAGRDVYGNETEGKLVDLDLSEATIVAGGGAYYITDNHSYICDNSCTKTIVDCMFYSTIIENIVLPTNTIEIMNNAFSECKSLTSIIIPEGTTLIGDGVFSGCSSLASITIPDGVTSIGDAAFSRCSSLETIEIPESISIIESGLFNECKSLTNVILPSTITSIGSFAFWYCTSLKSIIIPEGVTSIGDYAFGSCSNLETINIPNGVTEIPRGLFNDCYSLTSVVIPDGVVSIGDYAFSQCDTFTNIDIPNGVVKIGKSVFYDCSKLSAVIIGNGVTEIGEKAFLDCSKLSEVTCNALTPPTLGGTCFQGVASPSTLTIPTGSATAYSESDWAQYFTSIKEK